MNQLLKIAEQIITPVEALLAKWQALYESWSLTFLLFWVLLWVIFVLFARYVAWLAVNRFEVDFTDGLWKLLFISSIIIFIMWVSMIISYWFDIYYYYFPKPVKEKSSQKSEKTKNKTNKQSFLNTKDLT